MHPKNQKAHIFTNKKTQKKKNSHSDSVRREAPSGSFVLKTTIVVLGGHILELGVVLEGVNDTLSFNGVCALDVVMVRQEELFGTVELPPPSH